MAHRVLVPLDGSALSETVLPWIREHVSTTPTDLYLLRVLPSSATHGPSAFAGVEPAPSANIARERARAQAYLDSVEAGQAQTIQRLVRTGDAGDEIVAVAAEVGADLIAMSTHGRTGLARLVLGSVTEHVVRGAGRPVTVLRPGEAALQAAGALHTGAQSATG